LRRWAGGHPVGWVPLVRLGLAAERDLGRLGGQGLQRRQVSGLVGGLGTMVVKPPCTPPHAVWRSLRWSRGGEVVAKSLMLNSG
jgi:hypothetical protein